MWRYIKLLDDVQFRKRQQNSLRISANRYARDSRCQNSRYRGLERNRESKASTRNTYVSHPLKHPPTSLYPRACVFLFIFFFYFSFSFSSFPRTTLCTLKTSTWPKTRPELYIKSDEENWPPLSIVLRQPRPLPPSFHSRILSFRLTRANNRKLSKDLFEGCVYVFTCIYVCVYLQCRY